MTAGVDDGAAGWTWSLLEGAGVLGKHAYPRLLAMLVFAAALGGDLVDYVFKSKVSEESASGDLRAYPNDGTPGIQPGFMHYLQPWQLGDLVSDNVRRSIGTGASYHLDFRVSRMALTNLGIGPDVPIRLAGVTGPSIYVDWADVSSCDVLTANCGGLFDVLADGVQLDADGETD